MISHDHKLFFIHIPKCAGRSVIEKFNQRADHFTAMYYATEYKKRWQEYDVFAIVRNPYDRLVSIWSYLQQHRRQKFEPVACPESSFASWVYQNFNACHGKFKLNSAEGEWGTDFELGSRFWFSPQTRFLATTTIFGGVAIDTEKIKLFKLEEGMDKVQDYLIEKKVPLIGGIMHVNPSKHDHYTTYYDEELLQFVNKQKFIFEDVNAFNYKFEIDVHSV